MTKPNEVYIFVGVEQTLLHHQPEPVCAMFQEDTARDWYLAKPGRMMCRVPIIMSGEEEQLALMVPPDKEVS